MLNEHERELMEEIRTLRSELARLERSQDSTSRDQQHVNQPPNDRGGRIEEALRESEQRLILAQHIAKVGDFTWDVELGEVTWSDGLYDLLLYDKSEMIDISKVNAEIHHPDDLERVTEWLKDCIESGSDKLRPNEYRLIRKDGETIFVHTVGIVERSMGKVKIFATLQDITTRKQAEDALRESEAKYKAMFENMQNGFALHEMVFDEAGKPIDYIFLDVNEAFEKQTTLKREGIIGRRVTDVLPGTASDPADWINTYGNVVLTGNNICFENYSEVLDKWYSVVAYRSKEGQFAVIFIDITDRKKAEKDLLNNQAQFKSLASELVLAEERERNRIAVHLHDNISQSLAYSKMKLQVVNATLENQAQIEDVEEVCDTLTTMMKEVHSLTFELSTPVLTELGLEKAISHWLQEEIEQKHRINTEFTNDGEPKPLTDDIQALVFRSVRELLTNVAKHSQAKRVEVNISKEKDKILVRLEDDGIGFSPDKVVAGSDTGGFGLFSIRERLSQLGGSMEIDSSPGQGCRSVLRAPLEQP